MEIKDIEKLLNLKDDKIRSLYNSWDKGDCGKIGIIEILMYQEIMEHKRENGPYYDIDYDKIILRIK